MFTVTGRAFSSASALLIAGSALAQVPLYGSHYDGTPGMLTFDNPLNGKAAQVGSAGSIRTLDARYNLSLYGNRNDKLVSIDTGTGAATDIGAFNLPNPRTMIGLSYSENVDKMYGLSDTAQLADNSNLYRVNLATGEATFWTTADRNLIAFEIAPSGAGYAIDKAQNLCALNVATGETTVIGALNRFITDLDWGPDGKLRGVATALLGDYELLDINVSNATANSIGIIRDTSNVATHFTARGVASLPAPGSVALLAAGGLIAYRRRRST